MSNDNKCFFFFFVKSVGLGKKKNDLAYYNKSSDISRIHSIRFDFPGVIWRSPARSFYGVAGEGGVIIRYYYLGI